MIKKEMRVHLGLSYHSLFYACYKHNYEHYRRAVRQGCHRFIQGDKNENSKFKIQAKKTEILEGNELKIPKREQAQSINTKVEILWTRGQTHQST